VITHGTGILLSLIGAPILLVLAWNNHTFIRLISIVIYSLTMLNTYISSTWYHWEKEEKKKYKLRIYDHISIYFLIGGTYTPFILIFYNQPIGHWFLAIHWGIIVLAILFKLFFIGRFEFVSIASYLFLGWSFVFIYEPITSAMNLQSKWFLIAGGLSYTVGIIFYKLDKMPYNHAIWHIFVLGGSIGHYLAIWYALS
jgi:hemolysin III